MNTPVKKISIEEAIQKIVDNKILLPAIQRDYVWKRQAIEMMFDSILRGYPINTLMFWRINDISKQNLDFYSFLDKHYVFGVSKNIDYNKSAASSDERLIVIDGQQRLTSIYIGLYGTFATEKGKPMSLYLRLDAEASDGEKKYDFRFLKELQFKKLQSKGEKWMKMEDLTKPGYNPYTAFPELGTNQFATDTMKILVNLLQNEEYVHYYDIYGYKSIDDVLEIFTRANNSGTPLSKGDLLLSVLTTKWTGRSNARDYVKEIVDDVKDIGYNIDRDWVIRCSLVLFSSSVKMKVSNISSSQIYGKLYLPVTDIIYNERENFKKAIVSSFKLISSFGLIEKGLSTKLAVISIVHFIFKWKLWNTVNKSIKGQSFSATKVRDYRHDIRKWLFRAIALNLFESGTDDILTKTKGIIDNNSGKNNFPYSVIETQFSDTLLIKEEALDKLLDTQKVSAFPILNIIFCEKGLKHKARYDMDHTHPAVLFNNLGSITFTTTQDKQMASDGMTYNSVRNLQLLINGDNKSKNKMHLKDWINSSKKPSDLMDEHCIPSNVSLEIADFKQYIDARSKLLKEQLNRYLEVNP